MANRSRDPFKPFNLTAESFAGFSPVAAGWSFMKVPVVASPTEPNILAFKVSKPDGGVPVGFRLVHGYNMHDCMRIKGYKVELLEDKRLRDVGTGRLRETETGSGESIQVSGLIPPPLPASGLRFQPSLRIQVWRLTSGAGDVSIWATSLLKAGDFSFLDMDVRSMPFPRVGVPDDPGWVPRGFTLAGLKHPVDNLRLFLRAKWNGARCDIATFLKLRVPAWADEEILTAVSASEGRVAGSANEIDVIRQVYEVHNVMHIQLSTWRLSNSQ